MENRRTLSMCAGNVELTSIEISMAQSWGNTQWLRWWCDRFGLATTDSICWQTTNHFCFYTTSCMLVASSWQMCAHCERAAYLWMKRQKTALIWLWICIRTCCLLRSFVVRVCVCVLYLFCCCYSSPLPNMYHVVSIENLSNLCKFGDWNKTSLCKYMDTSPCIQALFRYNKMLTKFNSVRNACSAQTHTGAQHMQTKRADYSTDTQYRIKSCHFVFSLIWSGKLDNKQWGSGRDRDCSHFSLYLLNVCACVRACVNLSLFE